MRLHIKKTGWHGRGFTLVEALIAMVLLGFAITALLVSSRSLTTANGAGLEMSTAEFLSEQIREMTVTMKFSDLTSKFTSTGKTYTTPVDAKEAALVDAGGKSIYPGYKQVVIGKYLKSTDFTETATPTVFYKITVEVDLNNEKLSSASWLRANY